MLDGTNSRLNDTGKWISKLDGRVVKITTTKQKDGRISVLNLNLLLRLRFVSPLLIYIFVL